MTTNIEKFDLKFWEENPGRRPLWSAAHLLGMTDIPPLPKTRDDALSKCLVNGHARYLPDNSTVVLDAFDDGKGQGDDAVSFFIPHNWDQSQSDNGLRSRIQNYLNRTSATPNAPITLANAATLLQDLAAAQISSHTLPDSSTSQAKVKTRKVGTRPRHSNASLVYAPT
ncbi:uncharacterized protein EI90DRAFT_3062520 [Cantharellus anzutake]|uniref:uncharacterized protein n=1 Tax=Cantharellus anzutake TaxID=1750568 RepID=UPI00190589C8|nr:uncharacterized protein EI90DRAFT_3062520 [Cantharellus anzutake]KAF8329411.1 hypothetical protein EI90DRAFT_3062520 [Cantharellus anzutake]